jgi:O-antigen/teichoic acid export membrane protein
VFILAAIAGSVAQTKTSARIRDRTATVPAPIQAGVVFAVIPSAKIERLQNLWLSPIIRRILSLLGWSALATALDRGGAAAAVYICATILGGVEFGRLGLANSTVSAMQAFALMGGAIMVMRFVPEFRHLRPNHAVGVIRLTLVLGLTISATLAVVLTFGRSVLSQQVFGEPSSFTLPLLLSSWLAITALNGILQANAAAFEDGRALALSGALAGASFLAMMPLGAVVLGYRGAIAGAIASEITRASVLSWSMRRNLASIGQRLIGPLYDEPWRLFTTFAVPVFLQALLYAPVLWLAQLILVKNSSIGGLFQVGVFNFCMVFFSAVLVVSTQMDKAVFPVLSGAYSPDNPGTLKASFRPVLAIQLVSSSVGALLLSCLSPYLMTSEYRTYWPVLCIVAVAGVVSSVQTTISNALLIMHRQHDVLLSMIPWSVTLLVCPWLLADLGAYALAIGLLVGALARAAPLALLLRRVIVNPVKV